jgi:hypothetical protein
MFVQREISPVSKATVDSLMLPRISASLPTLGMEALNLKARGHMHNLVSRENNHSRHRLSFSAASIAFS